eukprot:11365302-Alexandrium_andersonii.AAC.1
MLTKAYINVLQQFAAAVERGIGRRLRLPPLASGMHTGDKIREMMPEVIMMVLGQAFHSLTAHEWEVLQG